MPSVRADSQLPPATATERSWGVPLDPRAPDSGVSVIPRKPAPCGPPPPPGLRIGEWRPVRRWGAAESCLWGDCSPSVPRSELGLWALLGIARRGFLSCLSFVPSEREIGRAGGGGVFWGARGRCVCSGTKLSGDLGWGRGRLGVPGLGCLPLPKFDRATPGLAGSPRVGGEDLALCRSGRLRQALEVFL